MIDPVSIGLALTGIQKAVSLVKQASKTAQDVASLAPMVANLFDAKHVAVKAMEEGKKEGGSNLGLAMKIEVALMEAENLEKELAMLFMMSGKVDVWNKIKARAAEMDKGDKYAEQAARDREKAKKEEMDEAFTLIMILFLVIAMGLFGYFVFTEVQDMKPKAVHHGNKH